VVLSSGARFGSYLVRRFLGSGGMGIVYEAWDSRLQRPVALKLLTSAPIDTGDDSARLVREARAAAALNHPNVCTIYEAGEVEGTPFIAMELVEGRTLGALLARGPLAPQRACRLGRQLADALASAHAAGVIHRDLKCANVMVTRDERIKVLDFGLADRRPESSDTTRTSTEAMAGTLPYMAPEVLRGEAPTARSDIWALGVILYELVGGRLPFAGQTGAATSAAILRDEVPPLPAETPPALARVVSRCLEKEPVNRPGGANEVSLALEVADAMPSTASSRGGRSSVRRPLAWVVVAAAIVMAAGAAIWRWRAEPVARPIEAIAVLPFANLSGDPEQEFFSDGVTEAVITDLGRIRALQVIARGSVIQYKRTTKSPAEMARELGVGALVAGSVLRIDDRVRITAQLINPEDGRVRWSDRFDRDARDILAVQADLATAIAQQVRATIAPSEAEQLAAAYSPDPKAHEFYLLGRYHTYRKDRESASKAVEYLIEATRIDPGFALAYAALAEAYRLREIWGDAGLGTFAEESRRAAAKALDLNPSLPEAHMAMAVVLSQRDWNWPAADREFRLAIDGSPSLSDAHAEYSFHLQGLGRFDEAIGEARRATALNPLSADHLSQEGRALFRARRYDEAVERFRRALELDPGFGPALHRLIDVYIVTNRLDEAAALLEKRRASGEGVLQSAQVFAKTGRQAEARRLLARVEQGGTPSGGTAAAFVLIALGEHDAGLKRLKHVVLNRQILAFSLRDPRFDPVVASPQFKQILASMNLPE
jgi:serine/threonine-protein kinase